jgi:hypothetical protein
LCGATGQPQDRQKPCEYVRSVHLHGGNCADVPSHKISKIIMDVKYAPGLTISRTILNARYQERRCLR